MGKFVAILFKYECSGSGTEHTHITSRHIMNRLRAYQNKMPNGTDSYDNSEAARSRAFVRMQMMLENDCDGTKFHTQQFTYMQIIHDIHMHIHIHIHIAAEIL